MSVHEPCKKHPSTRCFHHNSLVFTSPRADLRYYGRTVQPKVDSVQDHATAPCVTKSADGQDRQPDSLPTLAAVHPGHDPRAAYASRAKPWRKSELQRSPGPLRWANRVSLAARTWRSRSCASMGVVGAGVGRWPVRAVRVNSANVLHMAPTGGAIFLSQHRQESVHSQYRLTGNCHPLFGFSSGRRAIRDDDKCREVVWIATAHRKGTSCSVTFFRAHAMIAASMSTYLQHGKFSFFY